MSSSVTLACPKCHKTLTQGTRFCAHCGHDISGVWASDPALSSTIAVEVDPNTDTLGMMLGEVTLGDYDIYGELGRGGMAAVYLALDLALNRKVAIKTMLPELVSREGMVQRFKREAQTAAALNHPHIIQIYTVKQSKQLVYFVMKFIEGRSLESVITEKGQVPLGMTQTILGQVGSALAYAHRKGVIHRDVKPANIMIDEDGWAVMTDFGIAKVQEAQNLTATGTAIGTPHYMSPEQFHNKTVTGLSDQYALGIVTFEMLTGKKPYDGSTYAEIITQHLFQPVPDLREARPDIPDHIADVVTKMLAKDPAERFPDLDAAITALGAPTSRSEGDIVRTQMISLAKSGPQKKVRMSVPMSPIPVQKRQSPPEPTVIEEQAPKKPMRPRPQVQRGDAGASRKIGIALAAVIVLALVGYAAMQVNLLPVRGAGDSAQTVVLSGDTSRTTDSRVAATRDSIVPPVVVPKTPNFDSVAAVLRLQVADSIEKAARQHRVDSTRVARAAADRRRRDSIVALPRVTPLPSNANIRESEAPRAAVASSATASIKIGSRSTGAALYVNGSNEGPLNGLRDVTVPAGGVVRLSIHAAGCAAWDTAVTVVAGSTKKIGYRSATCP